MVTARLRLVPLFALLAAVALSAGRAAPSSAAVGDLDESFGVGGVAITNLEPGTERTEAIALQDDGRIVVTGRNGGGHLVVLRYNADGSLDTSFGDAGIATLGSVQGGADVVVLPGGKILAAGRGDDHLVRLNPDGSSDSTFASDGVTGSQFFNPYDPEDTEGPEMNRVLPLPGGDILVSGHVDYSPEVFAFARYNADGTIDSLFGDAGQVQVDFSGDGSDDQIPLAIAPYGDEGKFVAAGWRVMHETYSDAWSVIARYNSNGAPDTDFGDDGKTTIDFFVDGDEAIKEVFPLDDDRVLAIGDGYSPNGDRTAFAAMYDPDGTLATGFGNEGVITYPAEGMQSVEAAAMMPGGKILIGGDGRNPPEQDIFLLRLNPDGTPDTTFGPGGMRTYDVPAGAEDLRDIAVAANGDIFGAGSVSGTGGLVIAVYKFKGSAGTPRDFGDSDCNGDVNSVDSLKVSRHVAALPVAQTEPCPDIGTTVDIESASPHPWGDVDCDNDVDSVDALKILRHVAALPVSQTEPCPDVGSDVLVSGP